MKSTCSRGDGTVDFGDMFKRIEGAGFSGHYMNGFGTLDDTAYQPSSTSRTEVSGMRFFCWRSSVIRPFSR